MTRKAVVWFAFWAGVLFGAPVGSQGVTVAASMLALSMIALLVVLIANAGDEPKPPRRLKR